MPEGGLLKCEKDFLRAASSGDMTTLNGCITLRKVDVNVQHYNGYSAAHYAAANNRLEVLRHLKSANANLNARELLGNSPLHVAILKGHIETAALLIELGVKINCVNDDKKTPLHLAAEKGYLDIVKTLSEKGAKVSPKLTVENNKGNSKSCLSYYASKIRRDFMDECNNLNGEDLVNIFTVLSLSGQFPKAKM